MKGRAGAFVFLGTMSFLAALQALATTGAFASRAFLPAFVVALVARFPQTVSWLPFVPDRPVSLSPSLQWLASDACLVTLGVLALLESLASRDADVRELWRDVEPWVKGAVAVAITFALLDPESARVIERLAGVPPAAGLLVSGWTLAAALASLLLGLLVFTLARLRAGLLGPLHELDHADLGFGRLLAWLEDAWAGFGMLLALLAPLLALLAAGALLGLSALVSREVERRADARRVPCSSCGHAARPEARACPSCAAPRLPAAEPTSRLWPDRWWDETPLSAERAGLELLAKGACPACAEARPSRDLLPAAPHGCGWPGNAAALGVPGAEWTGALDSHLASRFRRLLLPVAALGLLPLAGAVAALVLGRLRLVAPVRRHVSASARVLSRWQARLLVLLLLLPSGFPLLSAIAAPLILVVQRGVHGRAFRRSVGARAETLSPPRSREPSG